MPLTHFESGKKTMMLVPRLSKHPVLHLRLQEPWTTITNIELDGVNDALIDSRREEDLSPFAGRLGERRVSGACVDAEAIRGRRQSFLPYFGRSIGVSSLPFHYLPVIPLLLTIPLSPCKLTQRLWTLAAFSLIGSPRLKLSSDKTKALDSYAAPS